MIIALLVPVTSRGRRLTRPADADLLRTLLPGLLATATWADHISYRLYVGYDAGDPFYDDAADRRAFAAAGRQVIGNRPIDLVLHRSQGTEHSPCGVWNALFQRAYHDGCTHFYQLGDDVSLLTGGWAEDFAATLDADPAGAGLGAVGPIDTNRPEFPVLTQAFVSRRHMEIFGTLYPPAFRNWFSDNWLAEVYAPAHLHRLRAHRSRNAGGRERYTIDPRGAELLAREVPLGRARLRGWLSRHTRHTQVPRGLSLGPRQRARIYYIPNGYDCHIADALGRMFTTVQPFGCRDVQDYIDHRVLAHETPNASRIVIDEVQRMRPDLVYVESGYNVEADALAFIRRVLGIPVTMWYGDPSSPPGEVDRLVRYARAVDWQVVIDETPLDAARQQGLDNVELIPFFGYDHYFHPARAARTIDVLFSGKSYHGGEQAYPEVERRRALIRRLNRELGERLHVRGEGWQAEGLRNWSGERVPEWDINTLNNSSRIVLAYDAAQLRGFTSLRSWNVLLSGAFLLIRKFPGIEAWFENHRHLVWFEDEDEAVALVEKYLADDRARARIARQGHRLVHERGWKFSTLARYLVARGRGREQRRFAELHPAARLSTRARRPQAHAGSGPSPRAHAPRTTLVTFCTPDWTPAVERLVASALAHGVTDAARFGLQDWAGTPFYFEHLHLLASRRGFGYWIWKPYFIREALSRARDGDVVIYLDAGIEVIAPLEPLVALATAERPVVPFALHGHRNRRWTKRDAFVALDCDARRYWNAEACNAAMQVYRAGPESRAFVDRWLSACTTARIVTGEPNTLGRPNFKEFREHRFDQSLFSLLCEKEGLERFRDPSQWGERFPRANSTYGTLLRHHRSRS